LGISSWKDKKLERFWTHGKEEFCFILVRQEEELLPRTFGQSESESGKEKELKESNLVQVGL